MKTIFCFLLGGLLTISASADLVKDVDKLTPEDAFQVMTRLEAKMYEPVPQGFFTRLSFSLSGGMQLSKPSDFTTSVAGIADADDFERLRYLHAQLLWKTCEHWVIGLSGGLLGKRSVKDNANIINDVMLSGTYFHATFGPRLTLGQRFLIVPLVGVGAINANVRTKTHNDTTQTSYEYAYNGMAFSGAVRAQALYRINPVWGIGIDTGYFLGHAKDLKRSNQREIGNPDTLNLNGVFFGIQSSYNL